MMQVESPATQAPVKATRVKAAPAQDPEKRVALRVPMAPMKMPLGGVTTRAGTALREVGTAVIVPVGNRLPPARQGSRARSPETPSTTLVETRT